MRGDSSAMFSMDSYHDDPNDSVDDIPSSGGGNKADSRKSNKPIMEKRRRARINSCLNELKGILLEAMRKDPARHSKLEKADILELTVRHLQNIQRNQLAVAMATDPTVLYRFKNGFSECASEVSRYLSKLDGVDDGIKGRVSNHLGSCVNGLQQVNPVGGMGYTGPRYGTEVPFVSVPFSPPSSGLIPASNLTPPGDLNNNKELMVVHRPTPVNPLTAPNFGSMVRSGSNVTTKLPTGSPSPSTLEANPLDYSLPGRQVRVVKVEPMTPTTTSTSTKDSMWRPW